MTPTKAHRLAPVITDAVTIDGVTSPYLRAGPADVAEAVVFVHGNPGPAQDWRRLVARTGAFARAVAPDLPGHGGADTTRPAVRLLLRHGNPRRLPGDVLERMYRDYKSPDVQRAVLRLYRATDPTAGSELLHQQLRSLDCPALVVWGARDPFVPVRYAQLQRETFPNAEVVILHDSGHCVRPG